MPKEYAKPLPDITDDNRPFWEGCKRHELLLQKCGDCGQVRYHSPICPECWSTEHQWVQAGGRGKVYTWTVFHQNYHPAFEPDLPYNVAIVELEEGPHMLTNLIEITNEDIRPDMAVEIAWDDVTEEITLPKFRPLK
ncbi:Zn-ribbon domain-containing OB-fold protein [Thermodesulfobacteriota bacterium]